MTGEPGDRVADRRAWGARPVAGAASILCLALTVSCSEEPSYVFDSHLDPQNSDYLMADAGGPYSVNINRPVNFRGTGSDADGTISRYEWDFEGDGTWDWYSFVGGSTTKTPVIAGTIEPIFRVTDNEGNKALAVTTLDILPNVDFDEPTDLYLFYPYPYGSYEWSDGSVTIAATSGTYIASLLFGNYTMGDGVIEVETAFQSGDPYYSYGIVFRWDPVAITGYGFGINADGRYVVHKWQPDLTVDEVVPWSSTTAFNKWGGNKLAVVTEGSTISLYLNDTLIKTFNDVSYDEGMIALYVTLDGMTVNFDNLRIQSADVANTAERIVPARPAPGEGWPSPRVP